MIRTGCLAAVLSALLTGAAGARDVPPAGAVFPDPRAAALAEAAAWGDAARVRALAEPVALRATGQRGITLLQWALLQRSKAGLAALVAAGADPAQPGVGDDTLLHLAAMANDPDYLRILLDHGADPNAPHGVTRRPPINSAIMGRRDRQLAMLLAAGADPGRADRMGNTPLHVAAQTVNPDYALKLLEAGAPPDARNAQGRTFRIYLAMTPRHLMHEAGRRRFEAVSAWLAQHGFAVGEP